MSWATNCNSTVEQTPTCTLPLIGLDGVITNLNPPIVQSGTVTKSGRCTVGLFKSQCTQAELNATCNEAICPPGQIQGECTCVPGEGGCILDACYKTYTCTRKCLVADQENSCPQGKFLRSTGTNAICEYTPTDSNLDWMVSNLPDSFAKPMIRRFAMMTLLDDWMNALYRDNSSIFHKMNYLKSPIIANTIRSTILNLRASRYSESADFLKFLLNVPSFPQLIYTPPNKFNILLYLYDTPQNLSTQDTTNFIQGFTVESATSDQAVAPVVSAPSVTFNSPSDYLTNKYYIIVNLDTLQIWNNTVTDLSQLVSITDLKNMGITGDFYIIGRIFPVTITRWSPNLLYLFYATYPNLQFTETFCKTIQDQTLQVPVQCYNNSCTEAFTEQCRQLIESYCTRDTLYTSGFTGINFEVRDFFLQAGSAQCLCYNTGLTPPIVPSGNRPGMCFTESCTSNPAMSQAFGLTDEFCSNYCGEIYSWLTSSDPATRSLNPVVLDRARYQRLCGEYNPEVTARKLNYYILGIGLVISLIIGVILGALTKWWIGLGLGLILGFISVFLSYDLNGVPGCSEKESICRTKITRIKIPLSWCPYEIGCECDNFGGRCEDGSLCLAGKCFQPNE
jgi:hypothetical protein